MPDSPQSHRDISALWNERRKTRDVEIAAMNAVASAIEGHLPSQYDVLFAETDVRIELQTTRSAYDTLRKYLAEIPVLPHVDPLGKRESNPARNKAETVEKVIHGYHHGSAMRGGPGFDTLTGLLADHMVAFYDAVMLINPDFDRRLIYFEAKDPRCHFPPSGWTPWSMVPLDGTLLVYEKTLGEVKRTFAYDAYGNAKPDVLTRLNNAYKRQSGWGGDISIDDSQIIQVGMYRSREAWFVCALSDNDIVLAESQMGDRYHPGACGVVSFKQHGSPLLTGQIGIEAALMKVMNQQIQNTERINKAPIVGPPLLGDTLRWGDYNVLDLSLMQGRAISPQRLAPDSPSNLTQVMGSLLALAEKFNYNPESAQGSGPAVSGKAIQQLQAGPRSLVTSILFGPYKTAFPRAYDDAMDMELNLWPNDRKLTRGRSGKQNFEIEYTPSAALQGYKGHIRIEDARPGGYNAFLEAVQKKDAGMASLRDILEADPDTRDVEATIKRIEAQDTERFIQAAFEGLGGQDPLMAIRASAELLGRINNGKSRAEAITAMLEEGFFDPPAPEEQMGPPPELMAALGGGAPELGPGQPSLTAARGF
jgi:hypothetical protein